MPGAADANIKGWRVDGCNAFWTDAGVEKDGQQSWSLSTATCAAFWWDMWRKTVIEARSVRHLDSKSGEIQFISVYGVCT